MISLILIITILFAPQSGHKTEYDRFKDETRVSIGPDYVDMKSPGRLEVAAYINYKGRDLKPDGLIIGLAFYSSSRHWRFLDNSTLIALVDGERVEFGEPVVKNSQLGRRVGVEESMNYALTRAQLKQLAEATKVEMQIGHVEFRLKDKFLKKLRDLFILLPR